MLRPVTLIAILLFATVLLPAAAEPYRVHQERRPELFDPDTGYRIARQRAPTPDNIPGPARHVSPEAARALLAEGALALDVFAASRSRFDELDGTWLVAEPRLSLPGAVWLPETGRGRLDRDMQTYLADNLLRLTEGDRARAILVFCIADCWMSWNAAQRISDMDYSNVYWFQLGTDGWLDIGETLAPVEPVPVNVD